MFAYSKIHKFISLVFVFALVLSTMRVAGAAAQGGDGLQRLMNAQSGRVSFIGPESGRVLSASRALGTFIRLQDPALALAQRYAPEFGIQDPARELKETRRTSEPDGRLTVRYQQTHAGIPVMGGELVVNTNMDGDLYSMNGEVSPSLSLQTQPKVDSAQAARAALEAMAKWYQKAPDDFLTSEPELWIFDESLLRSSTRPAEFVWRMEVTPRDLGMPVRELVLVDALRGGISLHFNQVDTAWGSATISRYDNGPIAAVLSSSISEIGDNPVTGPIQTDDMPALVPITRYVSPSGTDSGSCSSSAASCQTMNYAIGQAVSGDTILVAAGVYTTVNVYVVTISKSLVLSGGWDPGFTAQIGGSIIDGQSKHSGIYVYSPGVTVNATVEGFSILNGNSNGTKAGGIYNAGVLTLNNVTLSNNISFYGGGIYNQQGILTLNNVTLTKNRAAFGGGIYNASGTVTLNNTVMAGNSTNNILSGTDCWGAISSGGYNLIGNNAGCSFSSTLGDLVGTNSNPINPKFGPFLPAKGYYTLFPSSPAVNAGNLVTCLATDQRGVSRPQGLLCDIGAFEYRGGGTVPEYIFTNAGTPQYVPKGSAASSPLKALVLDAIGDSVPGVSVTFTAPVSGHSASFVTSGTNIATSTTASNGIATSPMFSANSIGGTYFIQATVTGPASTANFQITNVGQVLTYTANNTGALPGSFLCDQTQANCTNGADPHADLAHVFAMETYGLYGSVHQRNSLDNAGMPIVSTVHYQSGYNNAFWDGTQVIYGDGSGWPLADDVVAHELTHGVTQHESNLFYYYQSGAISESFSDVWGEYYDQTNGRDRDDASIRWWIAEDLTSGFGETIRNMGNPPIYGDPDKITSPYYYTSDGDGGGVHHNSGINNKAVYLMVDGGSFNGKTVTALGWDKTIAIYYEVNTNLLVSGSDYSDLYYALQQACTNLIGQKGITVDDCAEVKDAIDAVEMNAQPVPNFNTDAPLCNADNVPSKVFFDNLEAGAGNWEFGALVGTSRWQYDDSPYGPYAHSGLRALYAGDYPSGVTDTYVQTRNAIRIPANAYLHFSHAFGFEDDPSKNYDGGILEYSINNGVSWQDAGSLFLDNGYNGTILPDQGNPLAGRSAFVRDSHGYISSRVNLQSLVNQNVLFRWRMGLDPYVWDAGWWLDDVRVYTCQVTVRGNAGTPGAILSYLYNGLKTVTTDGNGDYALTVPYGWTGSVTPGKACYKFSPVNRPYSNIQTGQTSQDYTATYSPGSYTLTGSTGVPDVTLSYTDGTPKIVVSDSNGNYSITVPCSWAGTISPSKTGYLFAPAARPYVTLTDDRSSQNFNLYSVAPADFTGDGKNDIGVFRPSNNTWYIQGVGPTVYGTAGDIPVPADYDGNGTDDIAVFRPSNSTWYILGQGPSVYGAVGDIPVVADYNGDGKADIAVFRPSNSTWYIRGHGSLAYGQDGDIPVVADYDGDGKANIAVFRPTNSTWYIYGVGPRVYGTVGDIPVIADYDGDGKADIAVFRPSNSTWYLYGIGPRQFGTVGDLPVIGDYTGDGKADIAVFRPTNSTWYIYGVGPSVYGTIGDIPV